MSRNVTSATDRLIIFTRYPVAGETKTRLVPALGPLGAAELQREMTEHVFAEATDYAASRRTSVEVRFVGGDGARMTRWLGCRVACRPQGDGDLGERMARAFDHAFRCEAGRVVLVGSDCPELDGARMGEAFEALARADVVLGPATDGGYYLVGLSGSASSRTVPALFRGIRWGTGDVLHETLRLASEIGIAPALLGELSDVDRPEDLPVWDRVRASAESAGAFTVVIPSVDEAELIGRAVRSAASGGAEVIVVDGGSCDATREIASLAGATVVCSRRGRAAQMNAGAAVASGDMLIFLHADTTLPEHYALHVRRTLRRPGVTAGAFRFGVDMTGGRYRRLERLINWRARTLSLPYGDQALFMRARDFRRLGGFRDLPAMEDVDLVRRIHHAGRVAICPATVTTSGRRWLERGLLQATLTNLLAIGAYGLGIPPAQIACWRR